MFQFSIKLNSDWEWFIILETVENKRKTSKKQTSQDKLKNVVAPELFEKPLKPIQPNGFKEKPKIPAEIENNQKWANGYVVSNTCCSLNKNVLLRLL